MYVSGTKPGFIAYLGETKFAPGEWAGVVLDEPVGKNDGSVAGVRYFQCEAKRGVFARPTKLTRYPIVDDDPMTASGDSSVFATPARPIPKTNGTASAATVSKLSQPTPKVNSGLAAKKSISGSQASLKVSPSGSVSNMNTPASAGGMQVGDRVLVSGTKAGTLRYLGTTAFAKGEWAGVELDDAQGKNDGSVAGKRWVLD